MERGRQARRLLSLTTAAIAARGEPRLFNNRAPGFDAADLDRYVCSNVPGAGRPTRGARVRGDRRGGLA